jgi:drug/metabolite transporter (DMT)-like permease
MFRLLPVLLFGLLMEAVGVVLLSKGLKEIGELASVTVPEMLRLFGRGVTNRNILLGVALEAGFFGCLMFLMSRADVSFIWPLTALSFVFSTLAAIWFLGEHVSGLRWTGIVFILIGTAIITYTEKLKERAEAAAKQSASVVRGS